MDRARRLSLVDCHLFCKNQTARGTGSKRVKERDEEREEQGDLCGSTEPGSLFLDEVTSIYLFNWGLHSSWGTSNTFCYRRAGWERRGRTHRGADIKLVLKQCRSTHEEQGRSSLCLRAHWRRRELVSGPQQVLALLAGSWLQMGKVRYRELGDRGALLNSYWVEIMYYLQCSLCYCAYRDMPIKHE